MLQSTNERLNKNVEFAAAAATAAATVNGMLCVRPVNDTHVYCVYIAFKCWKWGRSINILATYDFGSCLTRD